MYAKFIVPKALVSAADFYRTQPKKIGEILLALIEVNDLGEHRMKLDETQEFVLIQCRKEISAKIIQRQRDVDRKRKNRKGVK